MAHLVPSLLSSSSDGDRKNLEAWEGNRRKSSSVVSAEMRVAMRRKRKVSNGKRAMRAEVGKVKSVVIIIMG